MSDILSSDQRHRNMAAIHSASTQPELILRHALWHLGFRYKTNDRKLPGTPDIVLSRYRTVIFIHGCFWHGHHGCRYYKVPKTNSEFWMSKVARNQVRDQDVWRQLEAKGWFVIIVWECQLKKSEFQSTIESVATEIRNNGESLQREREYRRICRDAYRQEQKSRKEKTSVLMREIRMKVYK